jgi:hypothetical protein
MAGVRPDAAEGRERQPIFQTLQARSGGVGHGLLASVRMLREKEEGSSSRVQSPLVGSKPGEDGGAAACNTLREGGGRERTGPVRAGRGSDGQVTVAYGSDRHCLLKAAPPSERADVPLVQRLHPDRGEEVTGQLCREGHRFPSVGGPPLDPRPRFRTCQTPRIFFFGERTTWRRSEWTRRGRKTTIAPVFLSATKS